MSVLIALQRAETGADEKRSIERWYLIATPLWGIVAGIGMFALGSGGSDIAYLAIGVVAYGAVAVPPFLWRGGQLAPGGLRSYHARFQAFVLVWALCGNYFTRYFYEMLGMDYGFRTHWNLNHVPFFLYLLTAAYFTTYFTLLNLCVRAVRRRFPARWAYPPVAVLASLGVAWLETALNANPLLHGLFCYRSTAWMLTIGTLVYGSWFAIGFAFWHQIDERPGDENQAVRTPWAQVALLAFTSFFLVLLFMESLELVLGRWLDVLPYFRPGYTGLVSDPDFSRYSSCLS